MTFSLNIELAGVYLTSSLKYAEKYAGLASAQTPAVVIAAAVPGNPFPVIEGIYKRDAEGMLVERDGSGNMLLEKDTQGNKGPRYESNPASWLGKACKPGYQSHSAIGTPEIVSRLSSGSIFFHFHHHLFLHLSQSIFPSSRAVIR